MLIDLDKKSSIMPFWMRSISHWIKSFSSSYTKNFDAKMQKIQSAHNLGVQKYDLQQALRAQQQIKIKDHIKPQNNLLNEKVDIATKVQDVFQSVQRPLTLKKEKSYHLRASLYIKAQSLVEDSQKYKNFPVGTSGKMRVYHPDNLPIVLKESGAQENKIRFAQMKQARKICDKNNYIHLVIPTARIHGNFLIESRLPIIQDCDVKAHIGFYLNNLNAFTEAVEEFTLFLCQAELKDITGNTTDAYSTLSNAPIGRYDNIGLYLENGIGKLGLIDLEGLKIKLPNEQKDDTWIACREAVRLFPHHLKNIIEVAKKFDPQIEDHKNVVEAERDEIIEYFKKAYENHLNFIKHKNITFADPAKFEVIPESIADMIQQENKSFLGQCPDKTLEIFNETIFPEILDATTEFISELLKGHVEYLGGKTAISSNAKLLLAQTLRFGKGFDLYDDFENLIASKLHQLTFTSPHIQLLFASKLIATILTKLEKGKEIAYYNPSFGIGGYATQCIFC